MPKQVVSDSSSGPSKGANEATPYEPALWEKIIPCATSVGIVGAVIFLLVRNEPIIDVQLIVNHMVMP